MIPRTVLLLLTLAACGTPGTRGERPPRERTPRAEPPPREEPSNPRGTTGPAIAGTLVFGAIADCQYADQADDGERRYRSASAKLQEAVTALNGQELNFTVHLGDFTDQGWAAYGLVAPLYGALRAPGHHLLGNHDFAVPNAVKTEVPARLGIPERYRSFAQNGWRIVLLDGNDVSVHAWPDGEAQASAREFRDQHAPGAPDWNGGLGFIQLLWLDNVLAAADAAGESAIVMCHFPLLPEGEHVLWNAKEVLAVLRAHPSVKLYLSGHDHDGDYVEQYGIHFLTLRAMLDTTQNSWAMIRAARNEIRVDGNGREPDRVLNLR